MASPELAGGPHVGIRQDRHRRPEARSIPRQSARDAGFGEPRLGIAHSGAQGVGADAPNTIQPGVFFDKEFVMSIKTRIAALTLAALVATRSTAVTATSAEAREFHGEHGFHEDHDFHHGWGWRHGSYNDGFSNDSYY
jgi:hypothetical protein